MLYNEEECHPDSFSPRNQNLTVFRLSTNISPFVVTQSIAADIDILPKAFPGTNK